MEGQSGGDHGVALQGPMTRAGWTSHCRNSCDAIAALTPVHTRDLRGREEEEEEEEKEEEEEEEEEETKKNKKKKKACKGRTCSRMFIVDRSSFKPLFQCFKAVYVDTSSVCMDLGDLLRAMTERKCGQMYENTESACRFGSASC